MKVIAVFLIKAYQIGISPLLGNRCRFYPSCSEYALICFSRFSFFKALWYSCLRIMRCHPLCEGGNDPVPLTKRS